MEGDMHTRVSCRGHTTEGNARRATQIIKAHPRRNPGTGLWTLRLSATCRNRCRYSVPIHVEVRYTVRQ